MFMKRGKVWINGVDHLMRSRVSSNGTEITFSDLPIGSYFIWVGEGKGRGGFRSKKIKIDYAGSPINLQCSSGGIIMNTVFGAITLFMPNTFYKLKYL